MTARQTEAMSEQARAAIVNPKAAPRPAAPDNSVSSNMRGPGMNGDLREPVGTPHKNGPL